MITYSILVLVFIVGWSALVVYSILRRRRACEPPPEPAQLPMISVIVAALDEESTIDRAMRSLAALDYPRLEIIAVDDRSTDRTGEILDELAREFPNRLRVDHVESLPPGWLGKCHALAVGARDARGDWLLFTDADVHFEPQALRTAAAFAEAAALDHLVLAPRLLWKGLIEASLLATFTMVLTIAFRAWWIESPRMPGFVGFGAFNMIRRSLYERIGGHVPLRMEVADDMKLGYLAKKHGGRSSLIDSCGLVTVRWREGARDIVRGLERSAFPGVDFRWDTIALALVFFMGVMLAPWVLPFVAVDRSVSLLSMASIAALMIAYAVVARAGGFPLWIGLLHPASTVLFTWACVSSAVRATFAGGITWRGTRYSLEELRRGVVR